MIRKILLDILFYFVSPILFWNFLREYLGGYYTLLAATIPGTIYAIASYVKEKEHRVAGYVLFFGMLLARLMDLWVDTPEGILWNDVRINVIYCLLWGGSILIRKPVGLYFFLNYASYRGLNYQESKKSFSRPPFVKYFYYFTLLLLVQDAWMALLYTALIKAYGIEGYNRILLISTCFNYLNIGLIVVSVILIIKRLKKEKVKEQEPMADTATE